MRNNILYICKNNELFDTLDFFKIFQQHKYSLFFFLQYFKEKKTNTPLR